MHRLRRNPELRPSPWGKNLSGRDLSGQDLSYMDLADADFSGAKLSRAALNDTDLSSTVFVRADLAGADLRRANCIAADFSEADLTGADGQGANFRGADFRGAVVRDANFTGSKLVGAKMTGTQLVAARLRGANAADAYLRGVNLREADLSGADLSRAVLIVADLSDADLTGANLAGANLTGANLENAKLLDANLTGANLDDAPLHKTNLEGANLAGVKNRMRVGALKEHYALHPPDSSAFRRWSGDSVVVGDDKKPIVVYHGTSTGGFTQFDLGARGSRHTAFYATDNLEVAETYVNGSMPVKWFDPATGSDTSAGIYRLYIKLVNPMVIECEGRNWNRLSDPRSPGLTTTRQIAVWARDHGHDGVVFKNIRDDGYIGRAPAPLATVYAVFDPRAIKSATANNGNYDPDDADIRHNPRHLRRRR